MGKKVDLTGQRFGKLVVLGEAGRYNDRSVLWNCRCDCGEQKDVGGRSLRSGKSTSCGCSKSNSLVGLRFGKLVVVKDVGRKNRRVLWECKCDCGESTNIISTSLMGGHTTSCGCANVKGLIGQRFGKLVVMGYTKKRSRGSVIWKCKCDCGKYKNVVSKSLTSGGTKSCGCLSQGVDHHNYNPNLTDEERLKNRYRMSDGDFRVWANLIKDRDNYTCQICNQHRGNLNSHHLNGWNAFPEQRFDLDNGVTLCTDCHKEFHSQYGYGDNTREQFDEYAESKTLVLN